MATKNFEDRRARRSRKLLKESLLEQMRQKSFSEISVRDITDGADMNRCTFYLHYTGTAQLLESLETDLMAELQTLLDAHLGETLVKGTVYPLLEPVLDFAVEHRETCETLLAKSDSFMKALQELVPPPGGGADGLPAELSHLGLHRSFAGVVHAGNGAAPGGADLRRPASGRQRRRGGISAINQLERGAYPCQPLSESPSKPPF